MYNPPFRFVVLVMRRGEGRAVGSGPWHLVCTLEVFHMHSYQGLFLRVFWTPQHSPPLLSLPLPLEVGRLNPVRRSGERRKRGFWCILALKSDIWWQQF